MKLCFLLFACWLMLPFSSSHAAITATQTQSGNALEEIVLHSSKPVVIKKSFVLPSPPRLVIDLQRLSHGKGATLGASYRGRALKNLRFGQFDATTSRLVLDLALKELRYQLSTEGNKLRITLNTGASGAQSTTARRANTPPPSSAKAVNFPLPTPKPQHLAKQAQRPIIVIDAGHGGKDSGAVSSSGTQEKRITLSYAKALRHALLQSGRYRVVMTRSDDRYLFLKERVAIARKMQGDVFISLHADSNPRRAAKGLSVYTLSEKASDAEAAALARQENKADIIGGLDLNVEDEAVANILIDLAQRETNNKSSRLAEILVKQAKGRIPLLGKPHRYAGFRVLKAPDIPSILVEVGFLTNREDERRLKTDAYRHKIVQVMLATLDGFFGNHP